MQLSRARCRYDDKSLREPYGWILLAVDRNDAPAAPVIRQVPVEGRGKTIPYWALVLVDDLGYLDKIDIGRGDAVPLDRYPRADELTVLADLEPDPRYLQLRAKAKGH
jgi:hypothetical protein